jgi:hypothetical protein
MSAAPTIPDSNGATYLTNLNSAMAAAWDSQVHQANAYTTGGTSSAYTLTPTPVLAANAALVRYTVTFSAAGSGTPTLAVSGLAALPLMAYNSAGVLGTYLPFANQVSDVVCDGTHWIVMDALPKGTQTGRPENLIVTYQQSSGIVTVTCSAVTVSDLAGNQTRLTTAAFPALANGTLQASLATIGAINGTDGSTLTAGSMYCIFIAFNPATNALGLLVSLEPTSPTTAILGPVSPVSGYTQYKCVSINKIKQISPAYWQPATQNDDLLTWKPGSYLAGLPLIATGAIGNYSTPVYVASSLIGFVAAHAKSILFCLDGDANTGVIVMMAAPNGNYGAYTSATNPCPTQMNFNSTYGGDHRYINEFNLETLNIYLAQNGGSVFAYGFRINL